MSKKGSSGRPNNNLVSVKEKDYLMEDPPIRGQNYACVSFLCPEETLRNKEAFMLQRFVRGLGEDVANLLDSLAAKYNGDSDVMESLRSIRERYAYMWSEDEMKQQLDFFKSACGEALDREFDKSTDFATSTRGIKIRGVYDTYDQADRRSKMLHEFDNKKGNVFVAQVGCWCPWNPDPNAIQDSEYAVDELNTLMKKYNENLSKKDVLYEERRQQRKQAMLEANERNKRRIQEKRERGEADDDEDGGQEAVAEKDEDVDEDGKIAYDKWLKQRREASNVVDKKKKEKEEKKKRQQQEESRTTTAKGTESDVWLDRKSEAEAGPSSSSFKTDVTAIKRKAAAQRQQQQQQH